jgi:hypothetical protein
MSDTAMNIFKQLSQISQELPPAAQAELLAFAEFLHKKNRKQTQLAATPLRALTGDLETSANFPGNPLAIQEETAP